MIYLKNNAETQEVFIPKQNVVTNLKPSYKDGYRDGLQDGKKQQKDQLLNLYITENGQYEREDGWGVVTVDIPTGDCPDCPEGGSCNLGEGEIYLTASDAGFYELYAAEDGYDGWSKFYVTLENGGAIKIHRAEELIQMFNDGGGIDFGAYCYVGGKITDIQEISTEWGNATYTLDNGFSIYRGKWIDDNPFWSEDQIKVGAYIVVYGIIQEHNGVLGFKVNSQVIAYQECEGGEIVSCNIQNSKWVRPSMADRAENGDIYIYPDEGFDAVGFIDLDPSDIYNEGYNDAKAEGILLEDKWMTPSMADRDGNGFVVTYPSEGYDGLSRVVFDPTTIYNEGVEEGRNQGGGSGDCNIQNQKYITLNGEWDAYYPDEGYDGIYEVVVDAGQKAEEWREEGRYEVRNKLQSIEITENGRYSVDDSELVNYIEFDGNSYFDTNIPFGKNTKIEVAITKTTYEEDEQFIGVANFDLFVAETYGGFGIVAGAGLAYGVFGRAKTHNIPFSYEEEQILTLDRNGLNSSLYDTRGWIDESGLVDDSVYGQTIGIGKIKSSGDGWVYRGLNGRIRYVKIWTDGNDDSTLVTFIPKNMAQGGFGLVNSDGIEYNYISNLGEGTTTFISEWERKYGEGWREINVEIDTQASYHQGYQDGYNQGQNDCPSVQDEALLYDTIAFSYTVDGWRNHNFIRENMTNDCGDHPLDCLLLRNRYGECTVMTKLDNCSGSVCLENGWNGGSIIYSLKSNTIIKFSNSSINSYHLKSIDTRFAQLEENAIINCNALTDIKVTILNNDLSYQFATNCFNGLPTEGTITIDKNAGVTLTDEEITSFFRTIVGEGWTITIE